MNTPEDRVVGHDLPHRPEADAASQPEGATRCYVVDLGMAGGLARDQDEPPIAFNLGDNSSQRAYVDCDPDIANMKSEIVTRLPMAAVRGEQVRHDAVLPRTRRVLRQGEPTDGRVAAVHCVLTQTGNSSQVIQGFNERIFNKTNNPTVPGRGRLDPRAT